MIDQKKGLAGGRYQMLDESEVKEIHSTSLRILEEIGVKANSDNVLSFYGSKGAEVNYQDGVIRLPRELISQALSSAPSKVPLFGREEQHNLSLSNKKTYFGTGGAAIQVLDLESNQAHPATVDTLARTARLVDSLNNLDFFIRPVTITDVAEEEIDINTYYTALSNTTKHVTGSLYTIEGAKDVIEIASLIKGGKEKLRQEPIVSFILEMLTSPLKLDEEVFEILKVAVEAGIPVIPASAPMSGSTSPVTLAGTLAQVHAEALFGVVTAQMIQEGAPVIYGAVPFSTSMKTMASLGGSVEMAMMNSAAAQLSQSIEVPSYVGAGVTDSKIPDQQAGIEKAMSLFQVGLAGGNYIHHAGMLESLLTISFEQYVVDNDIIGMVTRDLKGIDINQETLAFNVLKQVVEQGDNFITQPHTVKYARSKEHFIPQVLDRSSRDKWKARGGLDTRKRAKKEAKKLLNNHKPKPLPREAEDEITSRYDLVRYAS